MNDRIIRDAQRIMGERPCAEIIMSLLSNEDTAMSEQQNPIEGITSVSHSDWGGAYVIREEIGYRPDGTGTSDTPKRGDFSAWLSNAIKAVNEEREKQSTNDLRAMVREEVARQLRDSDGIVSAREYIRLAGKTHDGRSVRGMLYFEENEECS